MDVLVAGGSGFVGTALCRELVERGHDVTALSRSPDAGDLPDAVDTAVGDVTVYDSFEAALEGRDAVVNLVALSPLYKPRGGDRMHDVVHRGGTENLLRAAEEHDVGRFVQQSALGADPDATTAMLRAKGVAEDAVRASSLDWVIVRPSVIFGDGGEFVSFTRTVAPPFVTPLPGGGRTRFQPIWIGDFAPMLADATAPDDPDAHVGRTYEVGGPEVLTLAEVARLAWRARGKPVNVIPVPMAVTAVGLAVLDWIPVVPLGLDQYRGLKLANTTADNDVGAFGRTEADLTTLATYFGVNGSVADDTSRS